MELEELITSHTTLTPKEKCKLAIELAHLRSAQSRMEQLKEIMEIYDEEILIEDEPETMCSRVSISWLLIQEINECWSLDHSYTTKAVGDLTRMIRDAEYAEHVGFKNVPDRYDAEYTLLPDLFDWDKSDYQRPFWEKVFEELKKTH
jgi:hypothetical protein